MSSGFADVELMQQRTLVAKDKADCFTRFYVNAFRLEKNVAHLDLYSAGNVRGHTRLAYVVLSMPSISHSRSSEKKGHCCDERGSERSFHGDLRNTWEHWLC